MYQHNKVIVDKPPRKGILYEPCTHCGDVNAYGWTPHGYVIIIEKNK